MGLKIVLSDGTGNSAAAQLCAMRAGIAVQIDRVVSVAGRSSAQDNLF
jgi:hypothetical protein